MRRCVCPNTSRTTRINLRTVSSSSNSPQRSHSASTNFLPSTFLPRVIILPLFLLRVFFPGLRQGPLLENCSPPNSFFLSRTEAVSPLPPPCLFSSFSRGSVLEATGNFQFLRLSFSLWRIPCTCLLPHFPSYFLGCWGPPGSPLVTLVLSGLSAVDLQKDGHFGYSGPSNPCWWVGSPCDPRTGCRTLHLLSL